MAHGNTVTFFLGSCCYIRRNVMDGRIAWKNQLSRIHTFIMWSIAS